LPEKGERLPITIQRSLPARQGVLRPPDIVQQEGFIGAIASGAKQIERLPIEPQGWLRFAQHIESAGLAVDGVRFFVGRS